MTTRDRLAEAIDGWDCEYPPHLDAALKRLLPVVDALCAERAAEELRAAADSTKSWPRSVMSDSVGAKLRTRAAALTEDGRP